PLLLSFGVGLILMGYRMSVRVFDPGAHPDKRAPILFLRGFDSDGRVSLQPRGFLSAIHGIHPGWNQKSGQAESWNLMQNKGWILVFNPVRLLRMVFNIGVDSVAELLAQAFRKIGPLVAIGRPEDRFALPGA